MIICITGGIASGKSTITNIINEEYDDVYIIDADKISRQIFEEKSNEIYGLFHTLDRKEIANIIFSDEDKFKKMSKIMNENIIKKMEELIKENENKYQFILLDMPLLFEWNLEYLANYIITIYITLEEQIDRIIKRDKITKESAYNIIKKQMSVDEKIKRSNYAILNDKSIEELRKKIKNIIDEILKFK